MGKNSFARAVRRVEDAGYMFLTFDDEQVALHTFPCPTPKVSVRGQSGILIFVNAYDEGEWFMSDYYSEPFPPDNPEESPDFLEALDHAGRIDPRAALMHLQNNIMYH